ncbi:MAG TPA: cell division protein ZapA [Firmicutes bacterium]|jgi:cell division protein ZapA|nr:cell division protein ZapA [Bacillota bacterium]
MSTSERNRVKVRICNEEYVFVSPAESEHLLRLANLVEERIHEIMQRDSRFGITRAAVMAAMIFADGMLTHQEKAQQLQTQLETLQYGQAEMEAELRRVKAMAAKRAKRKGRR